MKSTEERPVTNGRIRLSGALSPLNCVKRQRRLARLVSILAREVERLDEDNVQLRAAVSLYRDMVRTLTLRTAE